MLTPGLALELEFLELPLVQDWPALHKLGLSRERLAKKGIDLRQAPCVLAGPNSFEFAPEGTSCLIVPAFEANQIVDLVALPLARMSRWRVLTGRAWALGQGPDHPASPVRLYARPLRLHRTPLEWLVASADGAVVLNWTAAKQRRDQFADRLLIASDKEHATEIERKLAPEPQPVLRITVPQGEAA